MELLIEVILLHDARLRDVACWFANINERRKNLYKKVKVVADHLLCFMLLQTFWNTNGNQNMLINILKLNISIMACKHM